jgi:hypothetical protein
VYAGGYVGDITEELVDLLFTADMSIDMVTDTEKGSDDESQDKKRHKIVFPWFASKVHFVQVFVSHVSIVTSPCV